MTLVDGSHVVNAIAERRDDLSALTQNGNEALGAIARENESFARVLDAWRADNVARFRRFVSEPSAPTHALN